VVTAFRIAIVLGAVAVGGGTLAAQPPGGAGIPLPPIPQVDARPIRGQAQPEIPQPKAQPKIELPKTDNSKYTVLPERSKLFVVYDDAQLEKIIMDRIRADEKERGIVSDEKALRFPSVEDVGGGTPYTVKTIDYPPRQATYDALYVIHRRLHFEDKNTERYGWDLGIIQPVVSTLVFYKDLVMLPNSLGAGVARGFWDTSAGKCLPGSATPYMLYPPGLTITGTALEGVVVTGLAFIFP
jgi:hypothetical protein